MLKHVFGKRNLFILRKENMRKKMLMFYLKVLLDTRMLLTQSQIGDTYYSTKFVKVVCARNMACSWLLSPKCFVSALWSQT